MADKKVEDLEEEQLEGYIKKELGKGFSLKGIKKVLIDTGHSSEAVGEAIKAFGAGAVKERTEVGIPKAIKYTFAVLVVLLVVVVGLLYFRVFFIPAETPAKEEIITAQKTTLGYQETFIKLVNDQMERCLLEQYVNHHCVAIAKEDIKFCDMAEEKAVCYDDYYGAKGILTENSAFCDKIENSTKKDYCKIISTKDITICEEKEGDEAIICNAWVKNDILLCDSINDEKYKNDCSNGLYFLKAHKTNNEKICNNILSGSLKRVCFASITKDISFCRYNETPCYDLVYFKNVYLEMPDFDTEDLRIILSVKIS